jgi:hypothetical protein
VHKLDTKKQLDEELKRLSDLGVKVLDEISILTKKGKINYTLMDTRDKGKYVLQIVNSLCNYKLSKCS